MSSDDLWAFLLFIISPVYHVSIIHESFFIFLKKNCHGSLSLRVSTFPLSYEISILRASYKIFLFIFRKKGFLQDFWLMFIELHGTLTSRKVRTHKRRSTLYLGGANPPDERKEGLPMYVTYFDLIQFCIFIVALVSLCYEIFKDKRK